MSKFTRGLNRAFNNVGKFINNITGVSATQEYNSEEAEKQRLWEETMRNTSVSSMNTQLKDAGINTAMYWSNGGSGAAVPNGAAASSSASGGMAMASIIGSIASMSVGLAKNGMKSQAKQAAYMVMKSMNQAQKQKYNFDNVFTNIDDAEI